MTNPPGPRIGYWSRSNRDGVGEAARLAVFDAEIRRRIPRAAVHAYAPLGPRHGNAGGSGFAAADLGEWSVRRTSELAETLDCVVVGGQDPIPTTDAAAAAGYGPAGDEVRRARASSFFVEGLGLDLERRCPVGWDAVRIAELDGASARRLRSAVTERPYLAVRDEESRDRLTRAGIERAVAVVPDPLVLLPRVVPETVLARRLEFVRHMEWFPREGEVLAIQGDRGLAPYAELIAEAVAESLAKNGASVVLLETEAGSGEAEFLDALARALGRAVSRLPSDASFLDRLTVLAHARAFLGSSSGALAAASAFGTPTLGLPAATLPDAAWIERMLAAPRAKPAPVPDVEARIGEHFDALARLAENAWARRQEESQDSAVRLAVELRETEHRLEAWRTAHEARSREVVEGRLRMASLLDATKKDVAAHFQQLSEELARVRAEQKAFYIEAEKVSKDAAATRVALSAAEADLELARRSDAESRFARDDAERRTERARNEISELRTDLDRAEARLEALRAEEAELRTTQTLLFAELAEARAELGRPSRESEPS